MSDRRKGVEFLSGYLLSVVTKHAKWRAMSAVRIVFEVIALHVEGGGEVHIPGFGVFYEKRQAAKRVRNFDGTYTTAPASRSIGFRSAAAVKVKQ